MSIKNLFMATAFLSGLLLGGFVRADNHERPCKADFEKFCKDVKGRGQKMACLAQHKEELSPACKAKAESVREHAKEAKDACQDDVKKFCADTKPGGGAIIKCLKGHEAELSEACKGQFQKGPKN